MLRFHVSLLVLGLAIGVGCDSKESEPAKTAAAGKDAAPASKKAADEEPAADAKAPEPAEPEGPMYKTQGIAGEMSSPLVETDLTPMGFDGVKITAPKDARIEDKSPSGHKLVWAGGNYSLTIRKGADLDSNRKTFEMLDPDGKLVVDEPDTVVFERANGGSMLFAATTKVGEEDYTCSTVATAMPFKRDQVDQMVASCKTLTKG